ncbi:MAG: ABC transporter permease [Spirochaetaceae bacterium]|nr:ABC transporter permease [Spirochaetaceae bacterium]
MNNSLQKMLLKKILYTSNKKKLRNQFILISLIVMLLVLSQIFVDSMSEGIISRYALLGSGNIETSVSADISSYDFVEQADDVFVGNALAYGKENSQICILKGVDDNYFTGIRESVITLEKTDVNSTLDNIYISKTLSDELNINLGEKMVLVSDNGKSNIYPKLCFVKGIYDSGYKELDQYLIFSNKSLISKIYGNNVNKHKEIILKNSISTDNALSIMKDDGISALAWYEVEVSLYQNLLVSTQTLLMVFIAIALLSGFFISSVASDLIGSSHKNIAIEKLLGLHSSKIRQVYFIAIELITILSILTGITLGVLLSYIFPIFLREISTQSIPSLSWYLLSFNIKIPVQKLLLIVFSLLGISVVSVFLALRRTDKIEPFELLYTE